MLLEGKVVKLRQQAIHVTVLGFSSAVIIEEDIPKEFRYKIVPSSLNAQKQHLFCKILVLLNELDRGTSTSDEYAITYALRNVYRKLKSDLQGSRKRMAELVEQCNALKKGREDSSEACNHKCAFCHSSKAADISTDF
ncbi:hypothetical protein AgCh_017380 [Apium graveolens]